MTVFTNQNQVFVWSITQQYFGVYNKITSSRKLLSMPLRETWRNHGRWKKQHNTKTKVNSVKTITCNYSFNQFEAWCRYGERLNVFIYLAKYKLPTHYDQFKSLPDGAVASVLLFFKECCNYFILHSVLESKFFTRWVNWIRASFSNIFDRMASI